jgi:transposase InsO family protein
VSPRRACQTVEQPRSTQRYRARKPAADQPLVKRLRELAARHPRYGYRRITALLRAEGRRVNRKRVQRLWRAEGLKVPIKQAKRRRLGQANHSTQRRCAERPNQVWSYDFVWDQTADGRPLKRLPVVDEYTRECLALPVARAVREWLASERIATLYIEPGSPWQNAYSESFHRRLRDEFLDRELFDSLTEARVMGGGYRREHNERRPHSALGYRTPREFAMACRENIFLPLGGGKGVEQRQRPKTLIQVGT